MAIWAPFSTKKLSNLNLNSARVMNSSESYENQQMFVICDPVITMKSIGQSSNATKLQIDLIKEIVKLFKYLQFWLPKLYYFEIILFVYFISCWAKFQYLKISTPRYFGIFCQNSQIYTEKAYVTILDIKKVKFFLKFVNISWIILLLQLWYCETPRRVNLFASGWTRPLRPLSDLCTGPK